MASILRVPGIGETTPEFRAELCALAERHGWNVDAIAAVISRESGFHAAAKNPEPGQTAVGLIQFTASTLRGLGYTGTRDEFAQLDPVEQLAFVERYYARAFGSSVPSRPVDYYLVTWGARSGLSLGSVLAVSGDRLYELNRGLDVNKDGLITAGDLEDAILSTMAKAGGERIDASAPKDRPGAARSFSHSSPSGSASLPVLHADSSGPAVELFVACVNACYGPSVAPTTLGTCIQGVQRAEHLKEDRVVGPLTWQALTRRLAERHG